MGNLFRQIDVLILPFAACLVLTGIHAYLGIHVLSRKVIFVDIALAQIAALGATVAFLLGHDPRSQGAYWLSLGFAVLAAAVFALTRTRAERVPQEAIIGLTYAVAAAAAILLADISPHGAEHLKDLMAGSIVWVTPEQLIKTTLLYAAIGAFHIAFRRQFLLISLDPDRAYAEGLRVRFWDFLFYLSFGVVITSSVQIAGVLLVFCYLVAPAVFAVMFSDRLRTRLALGWAVGSAVSAAGLLLSYDRPSGPMIMVCFAIVLVAGAAARGVLRAPSRARARALAAACLLVLAGLGYGVARWSAIAPAPGHRHGVAESGAAQVAEDRAGAHAVGSSPDDLRLALGDSHAAVRAHAVDALAASRDASSAPAIAALLEDPSTLVREHAAEALGRLGAAPQIPALRAAAGRPEEDEWVRLHAAESMARLGEPDGVGILLRIARDGQARLARLNALSAAARMAGLSQEADSVGADPDAAPARRLLETLQAWWAAEGTNLVWDESDASFRPAAGAP